MLKGDIIGAEGRDLSFRQNWEVGLGREAGEPCSSTERATWPKPQPVGGRRGYLTLMDTTGALSAIRRERWPRSAQSGCGLGSASTLHAVSGNLSDLQGSCSVCGSPTVEARLGVFLLPLL